MTKYKELMGKHHSELMNLEDRYLNDRDTLLELQRSELLKAQERETLESQNNTN